MSHTGRRSRGKVRNPFSNGPEKVHVNVIDTLNQSGTLEGDVLEGEITGNGNDVLVGLSNVKQFDSNTVFLNNQKGIAIGYLVGSTHFCAFSNNGSGAATSVTQFPVLKDKTTHLFKIQRSLTKIECWLDTSYKLTLTTNIPAFGEQLNLVTYGFY